MPDGHQPDTRDLWERVRDMQKAYKERDKEYYAALETIDKLKDKVKALKLALKEVRDE